MPQLGIEFYLTNGTHMLKELVQAFLSSLRLDIGSYPSRTMPLAGCYTNTIPRLQLHQTKKRVCGAEIAGLLKRSAKTQLPLVFHYWIKDGERVKHFTTTNTSPRQQRHVHLASPKRMGSSRTSLDASDSTESHTFFFVAGARLPITTKNWASW